MYIIPTLIPPLHQFTKSSLSTHITGEHYKWHSPMTRRWLIASPKRHTRRSLTNNSSTLDIQALSSSIRGSNSALDRPLVIRSPHTPYVQEENLKDQSAHTFAMIYLGRTSICCRTLTRASATTEPIFKDDNSSAPVISFRLVITNVSCPA